MKRTLRLVFCLSVLAACLASIPTSVGANESFTFEDDVLNRLKTNGLGAAREYCDRQLQQRMKDIKDPGPGHDRRGQLRQVGLVLYIQGVRADVEGANLAVSGEIPDQFENEIWKPLWEQARQWWETESTILKQWREEIGPLPADYSRQKYAYHRILDFESAERSRRQWLIAFARLAKVAGRRDLVDEVFHLAEGPIERLANSEDFWDARVDLKAEYLSKMDVLESMSQAYEALAAEEEASTARRKTILRAWRVGGVAGGLLAFALAYMGWYRRGIAGHPGNPVGITPP